MGSGELEMGLVKRFDRLKSGGGIDNALFVLAGLAVSTNKKNDISQLLDIRSQYTAYL